MTTSSGSRWTRCLCFGLRGVGLLCLLALVGPLVEPVSASRLLVVMPQATTLSHYMNLGSILGALASGGGHRVTFLMSETNSAVTHGRVRVPPGREGARTKEDGDGDGFEFVLYRGPLEPEQIRISQRNFHERVTTKAARDTRLGESLLEAYMSFFSSFSSSSSSCSSPSCSSSGTSSGSTSSSSSSSSSSYSVDTSTTSTITTTNPWHQSVAECDSILGNATLLAALRQTGFDLLIGDTAASLCPPLLARSLAVPFVQYSSQGFRALRHDRWFGAGFRPAFMPVPLMPFCDAMGLGERLLNLVAYGVSVLLIERNNYEPFERLRERHGLGAGEPLARLLRESRLHLVNANVQVLDFVQPVLPNMIPVGGVNARPAKPLDQDLTEFFEGSGPHGVVVISMGTWLGFGEERMRDIAGTLSLLQQRVVWILRDPPAANVGNNTRTVPWLPMNDVLGHPKTRVLVNHGGTSTVLEAMYHGVPMVLVPLANDMFDVTLRAVCRGVAVQLDMPTMTGSVLVEAVQKVISEPSYRERASHYSAVMKSIKPTPLETAVFWIEHVLRHGADADYLRPASARDAGFWKAALLDVLGVYVLACAVSVVILAWLRRKLTAAVPSSRPAGGQTPGKGRKKNHPSSP